MDKHTESMLFTSLCLVAASSGGAMPIAIAALMPYIAKIGKEVFEPKHQPQGEEVEVFPRPEWLPTQSVNWAVTGQAGSGKSAIVNGLRNIRRDQPGFAPEGVNECTMEPTQFTFPGRHDAHIFDLPGGATNLHPQETYARDKGLRWFHGVIICIKDGRPTQFDIGLVKMLEHYRVPYYVVQNRFQHACDGSGVDVDDTKAVKDLAKTVKTGVLANLRKGGVRADYSRIYMINSRKLEFADGIAFQEAILADVQAGRAESPSGATGATDEPLPEKARTRGATGATDEPLPKKPRTRVATGATDEPLLKKARSPEHLP